MSSRLKAGAEVLALLGIWGFYFARLAGATEAVAQRGFLDVMGWTFGGCIVLSILVSVALDLAGDLGRRRAPVRDEREAWAGLRATRLAHGSLLVGLLLLAATGFILGAGAGGSVLSGVEDWLHGLLGNGLILAAHALVTAYVLAEIIHYAALFVFLGRDR